MSGVNAELPPEAQGFKTDQLDPPQPRHTLEQTKELIKEELKDVKQQRGMRIAGAIFFAAILLMQNIGLFYIIVWALNKGVLKELQWIFSVLVSGTLLQSYKVVELIVNRLFEPINYKEKQKRIARHEDTH